MPEKFLIVRTDRIGDVLLTTPMAHALREHFPQAHIAWLTRSFTAPLLENNPDIDEILIDREGPCSELVVRLRREAFDAAIVAFPRWRIAWATWRAGIPVRVGPASKPYSLLFSQRVWQHRSESTRNEADYNIELLAPLGIPWHRVPTRLELTPEEKDWARRTLEGHRIAFHKPLVILHPGSGGSSARWPLGHFMELGDRLQEAGCDVVVTAGTGEEYQSLMIDRMRRIPVFIAAGSISLRQLAALLTQAQLVVSNSTGPLHLAVALRVPTVSIYSPVPACHPRRWGPYPAWAEGSPEHDVLIAPDRGLPQPDMAAVSVDQVEGLCTKKLGIGQRMAAQVAAH